MPLSVQMGFHQIARCDRSTRQVDVPFENGMTLPTLRLSLPFLSPSHFLSRLPPLLLIPGVPKSLCLAS